MARHNAAALLNFKICVYLSESLWNQRKDELQK